MNCGSMYDLYELFQFKSKRFWFVFKSFFVSQKLVFVYEFRNVFYLVQFKSKCFWFVTYFMT